MTHNRTSLAATLAGGLALATPAAVTAQTSGIDAFKVTPPPEHSFRDRRPPFASDQFRGDRLQRVRTLIAQGEFEKARLALDGRRSEIRTPEAEYLLGVVSANLGNYRGASEAFRSSLSLDPKHIGASVGAALTDLRFGRRDQALGIARTIEARRASCTAGCTDAPALDRASQVLRHFLAEG
jgi:tetratricopeptide (TPR) repeat protein